MIFKIKLKDFGVLFGAEFLHDKLSMYHLKVLKRCYGYHVIPSKTENDYDEDMDPVTSKNLKYLMDVEELAQDIATAKKTKLELTNMQNKLRESLRSRRIE